MPVELTLPTAVAVACPDVPYNMAAIQFAVATSEGLPPVNGAPDASISAVIKPCRVLTGEGGAAVLDIAPQATWNYLTVPSLMAAMTSGDQALVKAITAIQAAIQDYINARN